MTTNRLIGVNYDAYGNQTGDQYVRNVWDEENRLTQELAAGSGGTWYGGTGYSYDPAGHRVMRNVNPDPTGQNGGTGYSNGTWEFYFYGINGRKMGTIGCVYNTGVLGPWSYLQVCAVSGQSVYFGGKLLIDNGNIVATDRLGSVRADSNGTNHGYYPYGQQESPTTPDGETKFATYVRDASAQDYAGQRYYNAGMGRFWSPAPSMSNVDYTNSATWNAYAYVNGDPINYNDPSGLGPVTLPPVVPGTNCSTAFINYAAQLGMTIRQLFDSDAGILGVMNYFEQQGSGDEDDQQVWAALDWTFLNRWNLSASDKAWF